MDEMQAENVVLVVPEPYIVSYPKDRRDRIWTIARFVKYIQAVSYTHLRAHETDSYLVCRLLLEKKKKTHKKKQQKNITNITHK